MMETQNLEYEKHGICKKNISYDEKVNLFEHNIYYFLNKFILNDQITKSNLREMYELLKNENLLVAPLPIFRYNDNVLCFNSGRKNDNFEHGKYGILTVDEIKKFLLDNYIVIIYTFSDDTNSIKNIKYRTIVLNEN
ncbi:MAG: hypothetical protein ACOCVF_01975 [bacterium]